MMMRRPITKKDVAYWRTIWGYHLKVSKKEPLGIIVTLPYYVAYCTYGKEGEASPAWVSRRTLRKRMKLGWPKKRKMKPKQMLRDGLFSLDEMAIAEEIINGG